MDNTLVTDRTISLLSRITGYKLEEKDITPSIIFLTSLIIVLLGVMNIDGTVTEEEKNHLLFIFDSFVPEGDMRKLAHLIVKGVRENQIYQQRDALDVLAAPLEEPEKLLLIGLGYEMSMADGRLDASERDYLQSVATGLGVNLQYSSILEAIFSGQDIAGFENIESLRTLLNPNRFQQIGFIFVNAVKHIIKKINNPEKNVKSSPHSQIVKENKDLTEFSGNKKNLEAILSKIKSIEQDCIRNKIVKPILVKECEELAKILESQKFRVAVVGQFNVGKSTFINALVGKEIQPTSPIPCSGVISTLRYGDQKKIICCYRNGEEEEIEASSYHKLTSIPEEEATNEKLKESLASSEIVEVIFEDPNLELCKNGVELVDSPGLNEHPNRTAITKALVKNTDSIIFLISAQQPLTEEDKKLLNDFKVDMNQKNGLEDSDSSENIFVIVNFWDFIKEKKQETVKKRVDNFLLNTELPILASHAQIHYIAAEEVLEAKQDRIENEYLNAFYDCTNSLVEFLTRERGRLQIQQMATQIKELIQKSFQSLKDSEESFKGKINYSQNQLEKLLEIGGEAASREVRIQEKAEQLKSQASSKAEKSFEDWCCDEDWRRQVREEINGRTAKHAAFWKQEELINDYTCEFQKQLLTALEKWVENQLFTQIIKFELEELDETMEREIGEVKNKLMKVDEHKQASANLSNFCMKEVGCGSFKFQALDKRFWSAKGKFFTGGVAVVAGLAAAESVVFAPLLPVLIPGIIAVGLVGGVIMDVGLLEEKIKTKVCEDGFKQFDSKIPEIAENISEMVKGYFDKKVKQGRQRMADLIKEIDYLVKQQKEIHKQTKEENEATLAQISEQRQKLENELQKIEEVLAS